ncbi:MAG: hypothetical protein ABW220_13455 [Burkholderiaceae bacterium]
MLTALSSLALVALVAAVAIDYAATMDQMFAEAAAAAAREASRR